MNRRCISRGIGSSGDLGFGNSDKSRQEPSAPDEATVQATVHSAHAYISYRDAPSELASAPNEPTLMKTTSGSSGAYGYCTHRQTE